MTIRGKNRHFIDVSRAARVERNLSILFGQLSRLAEPSSEPEVSRQRSLGLSRLDQGLGDLVRIVRGASASGRGSPRRSRRAGSVAEDPPSTSRRS